MSSTQTEETQTVVDTPRISTEGTLGKDLYCGVISIDDKTYSWTAIFENYDRVNDRFYKRSPDPVKDVVVNSKDPVLRKSLESMVRSCYLGLYERGGGG